MQPAAGGLQAARGCACSAQPATMQQRPAAPTWLEPALGRGADGAAVRVGQLLKGPLRSSKKPTLPLRTTSGRPAGWRWGALADWQPPNCCAAAPQSINTHLAAIIDVAAVDADVGLLGAGPSQHRLGQRTGRPAGSGGGRACLHERSNDTQWATSVRLDNLSLRPHSVVHRPAAARERRLAAAAGRGGGSGRALAAAGPASPPSTRLQRGACPEGGALAHSAAGARSQHWDCSQGRH